MLKNELLPEHLRDIFLLGDDKTLRGVQQTWHDYVGEFQLTEGDIPALLGILELWFQWHREDDYPDEPTFFAPIHAWRALGQLRALEAVAPMLANADMLDEVMDDWSTEDWSMVFDLIGPSAIEQLSSHFRDPMRREFSRDIGASGLREIAKSHPEFRAEVVQVLSDQLAKHEPLPTLNGLILWKLLDLDAVESAEVIERAFAAEVVDEQVCGGWMEVREKLGVEGLGIAPLRPREKSFLRFDSRVEAVREILLDQEAESKRRQKAKKEKARRKLTQQSRKRNRKAK